MTKKQAAYAAKNMGAYADDSEKEPTTIQSAFDGAGYDEYETVELDNDSDDSDVLGDEPTEKQLDNIENGTDEPTEKPKPKQKTRKEKSNDFEEAKTRLLTSIASTIGKDYKSSDECEVGALIWLGVHAAVSHPEFAKFISDYVTHHLSDENQGVGGKFYKDESETAIKTITGLAEVAARIADLSYDA